MLLLEFIISGVPFVKRHFVINLSLGLIYLLLNFTASKINEEPIYDGVMDWEVDAMSIISPTVIVLLGLALFFGFYWLTT